MKTLFITFIALLVSLISNAQETFTLKVTVNNATGDQGKMVYSLTTESQFLKAALQTASIEIKEGVATAIFEKVPYGDYAVIVLHDKNANEKMDFSSTGMPEEAYGMSNNPMSYGPPRWSDAKFTLASDMEIFVRL
ncbi:DUF2141 domain-containing protein [Nonlabens sp.]|uniref:DUF2141 domain-containing protein n=1 Tax=Nonlabens sp. TaxID=1888209 RepID=UPI001BCE5119|nr:DUF2141 domain-containing protein [Nonlabens sp.]